MKSNNNKYPKLVRDKIPEIVREKGINPKIKIIADNREFYGYLLKKLKEEVQEFETAESEENAAEELADVLEVIDSILEYNGFDIQKIREIQKMKAEKRGGFKQRILMLEKP